MAMGVHIAQVTASRRQEYMLPGSECSYYKKRKMTKMNKIQSYNDKGILCFCPDPQGASYTDKARVALTSEDRDGQGAAAMKLAG